VNPQSERREAKKRLNEKVKTTARVLLNRVDLTHGGSDLSRRLLPGLTGANFVAAIQLINQRVKTAVTSGARREWSTEELKKGMDLLPEILEAEVRRLKAKQRDVEGKKKTKKEVK
jgi:hypothetical protein